MGPSGRIEDHLEDSPTLPTTPPPARPSPFAPAGGAYLGTRVLRGFPARRLCEGLRALGCPGIWLQHLGHGRRRHSEKEAGELRRKGATQDRPACVSPSPRPVDTRPPLHTAEALSPRGTAGPGPGGGAATAIPTLAGRSPAGPPGDPMAGSAWPGFLWGAFFLPHPCFLFLFF